MTSQPQQQAARAAAGQCRDVHPVLGRCNAFCDPGRSDHRGRHINDKGSWPQEGPE